MTALDVPHCHRNVFLQRLEVEIAGDTLKQVAAKETRGSVLATQKVIWKPILHAIYLLVPLAALVQYHVDDFVMLAYIFCGLWHKFVDDFAE